jgi:sugar O-acyltransferase (sialic acid O-acetyltransferase NeuD family)
MESIFVAGASGHAKVVIDIIEKEGRYSIAGLLDEAKEPGTPFLGYRVLGKEDDLEKLARKHGIAGGIVAIGDNWNRKQVAARIAAVFPACRFVRAVHPAASVGKGVEIGAGTAVMAGAVIGPDTRVGEHCIVNTGATLDHDGVLEDWASLAPGVSAGGNVTIGELTAVAIGAVIIHRIRIGKNCVIGAGATVLDDIPALSVAYGTPARVIRTRVPGDGYL